MDALEFLEQLFDKIENNLKANKYPNFIKQLFGGKICSEIVCNKKHISQREEEFLVIRIDVKDKNTLTTSLSSLRKLNLFSYFILFYFILFYFNLI
jgi:hypothetical protein